MVGKCVEWLVFVINEVIVEVIVVGGFFILDFVSVSGEFGYF